MHVLIIGGTGLISTGITRQLLQRGDQVTLYNRGKTQSQVEGDYAVIQGDRKDFAAFEEQMRQAGPFDCVIDMVCFAPEEAESAIRAFGGRTGHYVFCSTVDVYTKGGAPFPIREDAPRQPLPSFQYAFKKARCEEALFAAHQRGALQVTSLRPAHTYGEGGGLIHSLGFGTYLFDRIRRNRPLIVHGDGRSLWAACHRDDVAVGFVNALLNQKAYGKGYHLAADEWQTWDDYHRGIAEAMGVPCPELVHIPTDLLGRVMPQTAMWAVENFSFNNIFDNSAARTDLGFEQTTPWVEGIGPAVAWLEERGRIEDSDKHPFYDKIIEAWKRAGDGMAAALEDLD